MTQLYVVYTYTKDIPNGHRSGDGWVVFNQSSPRTVEDIQELHRKVDENAGDPIKSIITNWIEIPGPDD